MTEPADEGTFPELFAVIKDYAQRDHAHQVKALRTIAAAYLPLFEVPPMPDARQVVEEVLSRNGFLLTDPESGQLEDLKWGAGCLLSVMDALRNRAQSEGYETYVLDADEVLDGLETILAADMVEDAIEDVIEGG